MGHEINKLLVIQTWGIGDLIMMTPALTGLRAAYPDLRITLVVESEANAEVLRGSSICDEIRFLSFRKMNPLQIIKEFYGFRKECFDAAVIGTHISSKKAVMLRVVSGIKKIAGDSVPPKPWSYTHWFPIKRHTHFAISNLRIIQTIFPDVPLGHLYFHVDADSRIHAEKFWVDSGLSGCEVLGIHPGGGTAQKQKQLPADKYLVLIQMFFEVFPEAKIAVFLGPEDSDLVTFFSNISKTSSRVILVQNLPLKTVAALIAKTSAFIAADTGLGHIASAVGVPVVTLAGPTDTDETRPFGLKNIVIRTTENLSCMPCWGTYLYENCDHVSCMKGISEKHVVDALLKIMGLHEDDLSISSTKSLNLINKT